MCGHVACTKRNKINPSVDPWYKCRGKAWATGVMGCGDGVVVVGKKTVPTAWAKALAWTDSDAAVPVPWTKVPSTSKVMSVKAVIE